MRIEIRKFGWTLMMCAAIAMGGLMTACSDDNNDGNGGGGGDDDLKDPEVTYNGSTAISKGILFNKGTELGNGTQDFSFTGDVTLKKGTYLLKGWVYIAEGAKLRIPAGTVIKGDKQTKAALIIEPGGYVEMKGTKNEPIVMTSEEAPGRRKPGDWGGLIICGKAPNNNGTLNQQIEGGPRTKHGGTVADDNSGIFQYLRVEFAGYPFEPDKEINGITFGSVGSGTTVDHLQVSYSSDDSYEWFGGTVNCKYLVAYKGWDDEFDTDNGFSGNVEYCLSIRDPKIADKSQSNGFESDNNASGSATATPMTSAHFSHVTFIGPGAAKNNFDYATCNTTDYINGNSMNGNGADLGLYQSAMQIRRSSKLNVKNTLAVGYPVGLIIDGEKGSTPQFAKDGLFTLENIIFAGMGVIGSDGNKIYKDQYSADGKNITDATRVSFSNEFFMNAAGTYTTSINNKVMEESALGLTDPANTGQNYCPGTVISDGNGGYIGAFRDASDNWLEGWTNFDPQNTNY